MKRSMLVSALFASLLAACGSSESMPPQTGTPAKLQAEKIYVAVEDDGAVAVLDASTLSVRKKIPFAGFMAHNVQVAPNGRAVWVTLPAMEMGGMPMPDEVAVIDPLTDTVVATIEVGAEVHPAHVVVSADGVTAWVTAGNTNELLQIDATTKSVVKRIPLGHGITPHGERLSPDGATVWVAKMDGRCVAGVPTTGSAEPKHFMLDGLAVQIAVTKDWVFASQYDTRQVARIDPRSGEIRYVGLPAEAQGPAQIYPTDDGATLLVADQGILAGRPASDRLYFVDVAGMSVSGSLGVGAGAHGVVVMGDRAYVTAAQDGTVSSVDLKTKKVLATIAVGKKPNGISAWSSGVGTP